MPTPPTFSVGQYNTAAYMNSIGLWLVKTQAVGSGVSSVAVTGAFSANYDNYLITYNGGTMSTSNALGLRLGSSTTGYYGVLLYTNTVAPSPTAAANNNSSFFEFCGGAEANQAAHLLCDVMGPFLSSYTKLRNGSYQNSNNYGAYNGEHRVASSYTDFTVIPAGGTMTGGTIRVYGYRN
jgi:hypothetical protein